MGNLLSRFSDGPRGIITRMKRLAPASATAASVATTIGRNAEIAARLEEVARVLTAQGANPYRIAAYKRAAGTVRECPRPISEIAATSGTAGLAQLPSIGESLARAIHELATTGRLPMLERLRGESDPVALFSTVLGIGRKTASRLHEELGIHTLEELEIAAHDGRLESLGLGPKRIAGLRDALAGRLGRVGRRQPAEVGPLPGVDEILDVDREYREAAAKGSLPTIAPRRFNPRHEAWLPILHTHRGGRHYTALFSNTARAHQFGRTRDWVVLYFDGRGGERQCTVITSERGPMRGRRIVRGREAECLQHYQVTAASRSRKR